MEAGAPLRVLSGIRPLAGDISSLKYLKVSLWSFARSSSLTDRLEVFMWSLGSQQPTYSFRFVLPRATTPGHSQPRVRPHRRSTPRRIVRQHFHSDKDFA